jgi:hypothetical protein
MKILHLLLFLLLTTISSLAADKPLSVLDQISPAWQRLDELTQSYLTDEQQKTVQQLAFAAAVADSCDGFKINKEKFVAAFKDFDGEKQKALTTEEKGQWRDKLLVAYGIATGLFAAEAMLVNEQFCSSAEELRETSTDHYWMTEQYLPEGE